MSMDYLVKPKNKEAIETTGHMKGSEPNLKRLLFSTSKKNKIPVAQDP